MRWLPDLETTVESLEKVCASRADLSRWVMSAFEQRQETVKLICQPCPEGKEDSASEFADGFKMYAYCKKHLTLDGKACPVHWKVERRAGMMHIEQNAWGGTGDFPGEKVAHGPLPRMAPRLETSVESPRNAKERQANREAKQSAKDNERKRFLRKAFSSPDRESREQAAKRARITQQERAQILLEISKALENVADSHKIYQALCLCRDSRLTYEDAQIPEFKIGYKIIKMTKDSVSCPSAVVLGKRILQDWIIEKKNAKNAES